MVKREVYLDKIKNGFRQTPIVVLSGFHLTYTLLTVLHAAFGVKN